ncbi:MAG: CPP1-like family protein [Cyanobacteriota bacterium]|nr:CPP1-like family protein [Cyanobacteriota bacterium]
MSEQNCYEMLGLTEASSFEDIQAARDRLVQSCGEEPKQKAAIEAAYDAILMERLRLRQEGKIKVPDRIRFAENNPEPSPVPRPAPKLPRPQWLNDLVESPSRQGALWPALTFTGLTLLSLYAPSLGLAVAIAATIYFLNRKEYRFWRAVLLTIAGLVVGMVLGALLAQLLFSQGVPLAWLTPDAVAAALTCLVLWACSSFLR